MYLKSIILLCILTLLQTGCGDSGPRFAPVKGKVTLDGAPVAEAQIFFEPVDGGRTTFSFTNQNGEYDMSTAGTNKGSMVGKNKVRITTATSATVDDSGKVVTAAVKEKLPSEYQDDSIIKEVTDGQNVINFEIKSK